MFIHSFLLALSDYKAKYTQQQLVQFCETVDGFSGKRLFANASSAQRAELQERSPYYSSSYSECAVDEVQISDEKRKILTRNCCDGAFGWHLHTDY